VAKGGTAKKKQAMSTEDEFKEDPSCVPKNHSIVYQNIECNQERKGSSAGRRKKLEMGGIPTGGNRREEEIGTRGRKGSSFRLKGNSLG